MKKKIIVVMSCMLLIATAIPVIGQMKNISIYKDEETSFLSGDDKWMKLFRGNSFDVGYKVLITSDGGYLILGETSSFGEGESDIWLIKTDSLGDKIWEKTIGSENLDIGWAIRPTDDGGYIIVGLTTHNSKGMDDLWLLKVDSEGNKLWENTHGYTDFDSGSDIMQTSDGGYIIIGSVNNTGCASGQIWLLKTDSSGNILWEKAFGDAGDNFGNSILITEDGGYLLVGSGFRSGETDGYDLWLIKTNADGDVLWDKKHGEEDFNMGWSTYPTDEGGYIITGEKFSCPGNADTWLLKIDKNGDILWEKTFPTSDLDRGVSVAQTSEGGYIIAGHYFNGLKPDARLIKTDSNGNQEWIKTYGKSIRHDGFFSVQQTSDGGYILTGDTTSYGFDSGPLKGDIWLLKTDSEGNVPINRVRSKINFPLFRLFPNIYIILEYLLN